MAENPQDPNAASDEFPAGMPPATNPPAATPAPLPAPLPNDTDAETAAMLREYHAAFEAEFKANVAKESDPAQTHKLTQDYFKLHLTDAAHQIVYLMHNASSDSVSLAAAKIVLQQALVDAKRDGDPVADILRRLQANDSLPQPANGDNT